MAEHNHHHHQQQWQIALDLPEPPGHRQPAAVGPPGTAASSASSSSSSSSSSSLAASDDDLIDVVTVSGVSDDGCADDADGFSACKMKTVTVSSLLMPSPCFVMALILCPPALGLLLFLFVQHFVPVFVQILMDM